MKEIITAGLLFVAAPIEAITTDKPTYGPSEHIQCLAMNMYHEARDQGTAGKLAVSAVVLNRVNDKRFPNSVCEVVLQAQMKPSWRDGTPIPIRNKCQFSWYCDGKSDELKEESAVDIAQRLAWLVMNGHIFDFTENATHYHANYVAPRWAKKKIKIVQIDDHIFYRDK